MPWRCPCWRLRRTSYRGSAARLRSRSATFVSSVAVTRISEKPSSSCNSCCARVCGDQRDGAVVERAGRGGLGRDPTSRSWATRSAWTVTRSPTARPALRAVRASRTISSASVGAVPELIRKPPNGSSAHDISSDGPVACTGCPSTTRRPLPETIPAASSTPGVLVVRWTRAAGSGSRSTSTPMAESKATAVRIVRSVEGFWLRNFSSNRCWLVSVSTSVPDTNVTPRTTASEVSRSRYFWARTCLRVRVNMIVTPRKWCPGGPCARARRSRWGR